jgi:putative redox protein
MSDRMIPAAAVAQAVVAGDLDDSEPLSAQVGALGFQVGGPDGRGGADEGPTPYDLMSASLAACTAMTIRLHARHKSYELSRVEVHVSYHRAAEDAPGFFHRTITLIGNLRDEQRASLLTGAASCPVGRSLGLGMEIRTVLGEDRQMESAVAAASYARDLEDWSIVNIDPD